MGIEAVKGPAEVLPLIQDRAPGQSRLEAIQQEKLEQGVVVVYRHSPFSVVVDLHEGVAVAPAADEGCPGFGCHIVFLLSLSSSCNLNIQAMRRKARLGWGVSRKISSINING